MYLKVLLKESNPSYEDSNPWPLSHFLLEGNFVHAQRIKHNINKKYVAKNKQTTPKIPLGSTYSVINHDNEMKFQP